MTMLSAPERPTTTLPHSPPAGRGTSRATVRQRVAGWLARHSIVTLRVSLGLVFLGFGVLKFIPGASPAESLAVRTVETLTFGVVSDEAALLATAITETFIGITLVSGRLLKTGLVVLAGAMVGIMAPLVLFFTELFPGTPTLEAQYVLKDIVLVAAGMVVAAKAMGADLRVPAERDVAVDDELWARAQRGEPVDEDLWARAERA